MKFLVKLHSKNVFFEVQIKTKIIFYIKKFIIICDTNLKFLFLSCFKGNSTNLFSVNMM